MSRLQMLQECDHAVSELLPMLSRPLQKALAQVVTGAVLEQSVVLSRASAAVPGPATDRSKQRRAQRLLAHDGLAMTSVQPALIRRVLAGRQGRVDLVLDATTTGASTHDPGTQTLLVGVACHGRAQPLVWRSWTANQPGQDWAGTIPTLLDAVEAARPPATQPVLLADRGLSSGNLARACLARGWHYLLRVTRTTRVCLPDGQVCQLGDLAPAPGSARLITGARMWAPRRKVGRHWLTAWEQGLRVNVVAVWRIGEREPWLVVTDLPAARRRCSEYRRRTWIEEGVRDGKSLGLQWQRSRVRKPERVERLLVVLALAMLWLLAAGQRVIRRGQRREVDDRSRRTYSRFQLGWRWLHRQLVNGHRVPCYLHFWSSSAAPVKLS